MELILALLLPIIAVLWIGPRFLPVLRKLKFGQTIYELGPQTHQVKQGTPTMGGLMFVAVTCVMTLALHRKWTGIFDFVPALVIVSFLSMLIGFVDDYIKVVKKRNLGLIWWQKLAGQVVVSLAFAVYCYNNPMVGGSIIVPFVNVTWDLGLFYVPLMTLVMMFMINSANLQDGLDGLLANVTIVGSSAWTLIALLAPTIFAGGLLLPQAVEVAMVADNYRGLAIFAMALTGSCIGFLRFNHYPAQVFMGDTGSMFIGGATVAMAMLLRMPLLLLLIAFTMVASSVSVILQRIYFKLTHGKRIFKMSPVHHHFELSGMSEQQVVTLYAVVTGLLSMVALLSFFG